MLTRDIERLVAEIAKAKDRVDLSADATSSDLPEALAVVANDAHK